MEDKLFDFQCKNHDDSLLQKKSPQKRSQSSEIFLSPSSLNVCIVCLLDITLKYSSYQDGSMKINLWDNKRKITEAGLNIEKLINEKLIYSINYHCICKTCYTNVKRTLTKIQKNISAILRGREILKENSQRILISIPTAEVTDSRLVLNKQIKLDEESIEILLTITSNPKVNKFNVPINRKRLIKSAIKGNVALIFNVIKELDPAAFNVSIFNYINTTVSFEVDTLCNNPSSSFKLPDINNAYKISYQIQYSELSEKAPLLKEMAMSCARNLRSIKRNTRKKIETCIPAITNAISCLLMCHNQQMNANAIVNSLVLQRRKVDKMTFNRLQSLNICLSHTSVLKKHVMLGENCYLPIHKLACELEYSATSLVSKISSALNQECEDIPIELTHNILDSSLKHLSSNMNDSFFDVCATNSIINFVDSDYSFASECSGSTSLGDVSLEEPKFNDEIDFCKLPDWNPLVKELEKVKSLNLQIDISFKPKIMFVGDNVDIRTKRRQYTIEKRNVDRHLFNIIAIQNRIDIPDSLIGRKAPSIEVRNISLSLILPTTEDENELKNEFKILASRDLVKYFKDLEWMKKYIVFHILHEYSEQTTQKSEVFPLGVLDHNEATTEGIIEIMKFQHKLVPGHGSDHLVRTILVGDLLTVEREQNAQDDLRDSSTPSTRLEGLVPCIGDFHTYGNFLEVIWHLLYHASSSQDIGTLFQARNFFNARSVPASPLKDINACEDFILKYSDALLVTAFKHYFTINNFDFSDQGNKCYNKLLMEKLLTDLVEGYITPDMSEDIFLCKGYKCSFCEKSYVRLKTLKMHIKKNHKNATLLPNKNEDFVLNYSKNALTLCFLVKDFIDARKHGDGKRILRLHKFLLLYFKLDGRTKYAYQVLHLLAQVNFLLPPALSHEIMWNRFANTKGKVDSNKELDRLCEHENRHIKIDLAKYQGQITASSLARCSKSYRKMQEVIKSVDDQLLVKTPSGRHVYIDSKKDVMQLVDQLQDAKIFHYIKGRSHTRFPGFPKNCLSNIDINSYKSWVYKKFEDFKNMNIYTIDNLVTGM